MIKNNGLKKNIYKFVYFTLNNHIFTTYIYIYIHKRTRHWLLRQCGSLSGGKLWWIKSIDVLLCITFPGVPLMYMNCLKVDILLQACCQLIRCGGTNALQFVPKVSQATGAWLSSALKPSFPSLFNNQGQAWLKCFLRQNRWRGMYSAVRWLG